MNYELIKQLQDAGFPFKNFGTNTRFERVPIIELSELIEACGDKFDNLTRDYESSWKCNYYSSDDGYDDEQIYSSVGKTPEEAVAKLWFKINKN
jgi:hypothetical protein